ncbi:hypothetical protein B0T17DRAFT_505642 [Bombardia bombarda]|uniref:Uncharacterized protein n=1 Tax=Bombardia bombarda TaxID=252184 RepID=A0AA39X960_9PEZI|nr:hypothetical protein B0T17DRAFT_505642 [Bombardia bombarda]
MTRQDCFAGSGAAGGAGGTGGTAAAVGHSSMVGQYKRIGPAQPLISTASQGLRPGCDPVYSLCLKLSFLKVKYTRQAERYGEERFPLDSYRQRASDGKRVAQWIRDPEPRTQDPGPMPCGSELIHGPKADGLSHNPKGQQPQPQSSDCIPKG